MTKYMAFLFILILGFSNLWSQEMKSVSHRENSIQSHFRMGSIVNHSPAYWPVITEPSYEWELGYSFRPRKGNMFFKKFNYPSIQTKFLFSKFGDQDIFGLSYGGMAALDFYMIEKRIFELHSIFAFGFAYITKTYTESPINNVIGSHLNFSVNAEVESVFNVSRKVGLIFGAGFQHFSNGHVKLPNLGINFAYGRLGMKYSFHKNYEKDSFILAKRRYFTQKNVIDVCVGLSDKNNLNENIILPTYMIAYYRRFHTAPHNAILVGTTFEYKNDEYDYDIYGFWNNSDWALVAGEQLILGAVSLHFHLGVYLYSKTQASKILYERFGISYQFPLKTDKFGLTLGGYLKAHYGAAELLESKISFEF